MPKLSKPRWQVTLGLSAAVVLLGAGLLVQHTARTDSTETRPTTESRSNATYEAQVVQVELRGLYAGTVTVMPSGRDGKVDVQNAGTDTGNLKLVTSIRDGKLTVKQIGECVTAGTDVPCNAQFAISVPGTARVVADSDGASLKLERLHGELDVTNAGDISLSDVSGRLRLQSEAGSIRGSGLSSEQVTSRALSGVTELIFSKAPKLVDARGDNGNVTVRVPSDQRYKVTAEAPNGQRTVTAQTSNDNDYEITAISARGAVTVGN